MLAQFVIILLILAQRRREKREIQALRASERMHRLLTENAEDMISRHAADGRILYISPVCRDVFGYSPDEILKQEIGPFIHPNDVKPTWDTIYAAVAVGSQYYTVQHRLRHKQGHFVWIETKGRLLYNSDGELAEIHCLARNITDRKQVEDTLRASEEKFRALFGLVPVGISVSSFQKGLFLEVNEAFLKILGYQRDEIIGKTSPDLNLWTSPAGRAQFLEPLQQCGSVLDLEIGIRTKSGTVLTTLFSSEAIEIEGQQCLLSAFMDITERIRAEKALRESETKFRAIFENAPVNITISRMDDGTYLDVNRKFAESLGFSKKELLGKKPSDGFFHILDDSEFRSFTFTKHAPGLQRNCCYLEASAAECFEQVFRNHGRLESFYFRSLSVSGQVVHNLMSIYPIVLQGEVCALSISMNITDLKKAEEGLREREEKYHVLFDNMAQGAMYRTADGHIDEVNAAALEMLGVSYDEFIHFTALDSLQWKVIREDGSHFPIEEWPATIALKTGKAVRNVLVGVYDPRKQAYTWLTIAAIPEFRPDEHRPYRVFTTFHDVTALKRVEKELRAYHEQLEKLVEERTIELQHEIEARKQFERFLRESEEKYRLIAENATDVIATQNSAREFTYFSPSSQQLFGYTPEELIQGTHGPLLTPEAQEIAANAIAQKREDDPEPMRLELEYIRKDGSKVWVEVIVKRLYDVMGQHTGFLGISRDISDRKQAEYILQQAKDAAESANRAKSMFLSNMSHELRTPLNAILGFAQLLARETTLSPEQQEYIDTINRSGEHLLQLINDVLDISKIEAGRVSINRSSFDLLHMLDNVEKMMWVRAEQKGLKFSVEHSQNFPSYIETDEKKLRQILINILGNAVKFTEHGQVSLRFWEEHDLTKSSSVKTHQLCFEISDTGPGIARKDLPTIFGTFRQTSHAQDNEGTGLGLAISRKFAQLLGGDVKVESEVGRGSRFIVDIQVEAAEPDSIKSGRNMPAVIGLASSESLARILVVDDHTESRRLLAMLLEDVGFEVDEACNGREALALLDERRPDLMLMDMHMPVMDGHEATREIRKREVETLGALGGIQTQIPIIALTASVFEEEQQPILATGCNMLLRKPISVPELFEAIRSHLGVEYRYASDRRLPDAHRLRGNKNALTPEALAALPEALLETLKQAIISGDQSVMMQAIGHVRGQNSELADSIGQLVQNFKYQIIWDMLQQSTFPIGTEE